MEQIILSRSDPRVASVVARTFPSWKGRKIRLEVNRGHAIRLSNYWDGGSRSYYMAYETATGRVSSPSLATSNPFKPDAHAEFMLPPGYVLVEHVIFCGRDLGLRFIVREDERAALAFIEKLEVR